MFREIRRKNRQIGAEDAKALLITGRWGVLAVNGDGGYPYAVPVNFLYDEAEGKIYFHGARAGHKADALRRDSRVCFTVVGDECVKEESWAPYVRSTVVFGRCRPVEEPGEALRLLAAFARKYYPDEALVERELALSGKACALYEIDIEHLSGKEIQEK